MKSNQLALQLDHFKLPTTEAAIQAAHALGIDAIGFGGTPRPFVAGAPLYSFLWDELDGASQDAVQTTRRAFQRGVIHAPFIDTPLVSSNPYIEREAHRQIVMSVRAAGALALESVTVHAGLPAKGMSFDEFRNRVVRVLQFLGDAAAAAHTRIGLENWRYPYDPAEHLRILEMVDHPNVGATLDVGHIAYWFQHEGVMGLQSAAEIEEYHRRLYGFIEALGPQIVHVHMHDIRAADLVDHRAIGRGFLDVEGVLAALQRVNFDGVILFELGESDFAVAATESVRRVQGALAVLSQPA
jgi:sugar phosphate isomerase/epimerase